MKDRKARREAEIAGLKQTLDVSENETAFVQRNGTLSTLLPVHLAACVLRTLVKRAQIDPALIEDVIFGCLWCLAQRRGI